MIDELKKQGITVLVVRQRCPFRGTIPPVRIRNRAYSMAWSKTLRAYVWAPPSMEALNQMLLDVKTSPLFTPGLWIGRLSEESVVVPKVPENVPVAVPEIVETPEPVEAPEPVAPVPQPKKRGHGRK